MNCPSQSAGTLRMREAADVASPAQKSRNAQGRSVLSLRYANEDASPITIASLDFDAKDDEPHSCAVIDRCSVAFLTANFSKLREALAVSRHVREGSTSNSMHLHL